MPIARYLRVAALVDLPRSPQSGGHVKCWERLAAAAANSGLPLDLTVYFSGGNTTEILGPHATIRQLPPMFSTENLTFMPYVPEHTDLARYHPRLARELKSFDLIHTTDGYFAFTRTAERINRRYGIPLTTSFHTDTPAYARIFTRQTIEKTFRWMPRFQRMLIENWSLPDKQALKMERRLEKHVSRCIEALVTREEDHALADGIIGKAHVHHMRLGVDKTMFNPARRDHAAMEREYEIPAGRIVILFVGRVDIGKNIHTLVDAMESLIAKGVPLHLITAGVGPALDEVRARLKGHVSTPGYIEPDRLARLYASVDGLALVSEVEIRSMAAMEAMASGCPVLASEKSGVVGLFHHTPAMEAVEGGAENWAKALGDFAKDAEKRKRMAAAAAAYSEKHLASWQDVLAEDLLTVWKRAFENHQRAAA